MRSFRLKKGIGIIEVMIAALVLGILYAAVSNLQKGNREALLRIRGRDGATEVAQNIIDNLGAQGLASFTDDKLLKDDDTGDLYVTDFPEDGEKINDTTLQVTRTWHAQPGIGDGYNMTIRYDVVVKASPDDNYKVQSGSLLLRQENSKVCGDAGTNCTSHVFAKRLDVTVRWPFKNSMQSISVSGVIR